ncbi:MAG TPA: PHP domain-containing protein [Thermodesulfovibrionales bacterium]|nr:PHP domain-containing protein [Thermodesulfovibrionales bacterium]
MLLCDFHIHTKYSDGSVEMRRTVDLFGQAGFDVIAITDHLVNGDNPIGKFEHPLSLEQQREICKAHRCMGNREQGRRIQRDKPEKNPYVANSDFHRARHLYLWKTLLNCEKNIASVKQCIRHNRGVAITLLRN